MSLKFWKFSQFSTVKIMTAAIALTGFLAPTNLIGANKSLSPKIEDRYKALETFARAIYYMETMYVDEKKVDQDQMIENALQGIVRNLDPHTVIMPKKAFEQLTVDTKGKFGGVGIIVSQEKKKLIVVSPIEDTPAQKAGIKSGDQIVAIDGISLTNLNGAEAVDNMRGAPGSTLRMTIKREGVEKLIEFSLVREIIKVKSVRGKSLSDQIYYIRITSFQENTTSELTALLRKNMKKSKGLVLDLRDNPGGLLDQAVSVVDQFIESGLIVSTVGRDRSRIEREFARKRGTYGKFPMVILVNGGSASASEIVAGALQDHQRSLIMGTQTFGKGSVQTLVTLPNGSGLKLTVARYYTPKDRSIQAKGISPDIIVSNEKKVRSEKVKRHRKEADLAGHIESSNLSDVSKNSGALNSLKKWPAMMRKDKQLVTAFTYLRGWSIFLPGRNDNSNSIPRKSKKIKKKAG